MILSLAAGFSYVIILIGLIFIFNFHLYFKYFDKKVIAFWIFWKILSFFILVDRLNTKYWLYQKLQIQNLKVKGNNFQTQLDETKRFIKGKGKLIEYDSKKKTKYDEFMTENAEEIENKISEKIENAYNNIISPKIEEWKEYVFFLKYFLYL